MQNIDSLKIASKLLKSQREKKGYSIEEVCIDLRLKKEIIIDIENGNFSNFKSYLFLKGYINNYANFLNIKVDLPEVKNKRKKKIISNNGNNKKNFKKNKNLIIYSSLAFVIFLSFFIIKDNRNFEEKNVSVQKKKSDIHLEGVNNFPNDNEILEAKEIIIGDDKIKIEKLSSKKSGKQVLESNNRKIENKISFSEKTGPKPLLLISYNGDSWTEIIDSNGDIIFFDLVKNGDTINFNILAPFEILLGDATVVNIKYNNKEISIPYFNPDTNVGKIKVKN